MVVPAPADGRRTGRRGTEHMFGNKADIARLRTRKEAVLQRTQSSSSPTSGSKSRRNIRIVAAVAATVGILGTGLVTGAGSPASAGTVGSGFTVTAGDLSFILKQIKIAERHAALYDSGVNPDKTHDPDYCASLVGPAEDQIPDYLTSYGLRLVDGECNNLVPQTTVDGDPATPGFKQPQFASADQPFPRLTDPLFRLAEKKPAGLFGVGSAGGTLPTSYTQKKGDVFDTQPRLISNLIVDQTAQNPAAVAAATFPVRSQDHGPNNPGVCTTDPTTSTPGIPTGCVPSHSTLFIPNVTTDVGLSPPYNALFTFFGQFFDHGVDQTVNSG